MKTSCTWGILASFILSASSVAAVLGIDDASNYSSFSQSSVNPANGGSGFSDWTLRSTTSTDDGFNGAFLGASGSIDTGGNALGMYANSNNRIVGFRAFDMNFLPVDSVFKWKMENNGLNEAGSSVGLSLRDQNFNLFEHDVFANERFRFSFQQGDANYTITDSNGDVDTGIGWRNTGLALEFTLTDVNAYSLQVFDVSTSSDLGTFSGTLGGTADATLNSFSIFNRFAGGGQDAYFNEFEVIGSDAAIPEPSVLGLLFVGGAMVSRRLRRLSRS